MQTNSKCECNGILARVKREVFAAAVMPRSEERDALLKFWHGVQRKAEAVYNRNGLFFAQRKHPTKVQRAYDCERMSRVGHWSQSSEARHEARQLGLTQ